MVAFYAVDVAIEDAGIAGLSEEDEGVSKGFEEGLDSCFESLVRLCIVVPDWRGDGCSAWGERETWK